MSGVRIAMLAPLARPVVTGGGSAIEELVWLLTEELVARGHDVALFASGDSATSARLAAAYPRGYRADEALWDNSQFHELVHAAAAFERAAEFDVVHSHLYAFPAPMAGLVRTPVLHTDHMPAEPDLLACYARYPRARVVAVSAYHRRKLAAVPGVAVVHNGIDTARFPFRPVGGDYLLFLGHLIPRKCPVEAIRVARAAGMPIVLAGKAKGDYFDAEVKPLLDGRDVHYVGPVAVPERDALLAGAGALVFTGVTEPFGLVLVEAMACGTPVVALDRCAVPEIVRDGISGYRAPDVERLAARVPAALALDRQAVAADARTRFDHHRMADDYERLYARAVADYRESTGS